MIHCFYGSKEIAAQYLKLGYHIGIGGAVPHIPKEVADSGVPFDHLVCACGSGGTAAGCVLGAKLYLPETKVMCSMVDNDPFNVIVPKLMQEAADLLGIPVEIPVPDLLDMCGPGYSIPSAEGNEAIVMMMRLEGIVLDTCYTGKAFAGLVRRAREGYDKPEGECAVRTYGRRRGTVCAGVGNKTSIR